VIVRSCGHVPATVISLNVKVRIRSQLSVPVGVPVLAGKVLAEHSIVVLGGHTIEGAEKSVTMMTWRQVLLLPQPSEATQVRLMVIKTGHTPPIVTSENVTVGVLQLSVAVAFPVFGGKLLTEQLIVTLGGQVMVGARLSSTTIDWVQVFVLPQSSVASHVRVIVLSCGHAPAAVISEKVIVAELSQLSVAVALPVLAGRVLSVQRTVTLAGQVMAGPWLSSTKMI